MSELFRHSKGLNLFLGLLSQSIEDGALPSLMAAVEPSVKGGDFVGPGGFLTIKGLPTVQRSRPFARPGSGSEALGGGARPFRRQLSLS